MQMKKITNSFYLDSRNKWNNVFGKAYEQINFIG